MTLVHGISFNHYKKTGKYKERRSMASPWREVNLPFLVTVVRINDRENLLLNDMLYHRKHFWKKKPVNTGCLMIGDAYL